MTLIIVCEECGEEIPYEVELRHEVAGPDSIVLVIAPHQCEEETE